MKVEGYKSIRSAEIGLGTINVLIGPNGAGKSNLLGLSGLQHQAPLPPHRSPAAPALGSPP